MLARFHSRIHIRRIPAPAVLAALLMAGILAAGTVLATVTHVPVEVHLAGPPRAAEPGRPWQTTIEVVAFEAVELEELFLNTGRTWRILGDRPPGRLTLAAGETRSIPVTLISDDPTEPFVIEYQYHGTFVRSTVEVSSDAVARHHSRGLVRVDDSEVIRQLSGQADDQAHRPAAGEPAAWSRHREPDLERLSRSETLDRRAAPAATNIRVVGWFNYIRMNDAVATGVDGATARVYDEDTGPDELLATQVLGPDGRLDVTFSWDPCFGCDGTPDLYVEFELANGEIEVEDGTVWQNNYTWETGVWGDFGGTYLDIGAQSPGNPAEMAACHIMVNAMRAWRLAYGLGYDTHELDYQWPQTDPCGACYSPANATIYLDNNRVWNDNTITHEYGHHLNAWIGANLTPTYCNPGGFCDTPSCTHCEWCRENANVAFIEGFANFYNNAVLRRYTFPPVTPIRSYESVMNCGTDNMAHDPWTTEGWFAGLLQDIDDTNQDNDPTTIGLANDELNLDIDEILYVVDTFHPSTPAEFITRFNQTYPQYKEQMWATSSNNGYQYDVQPPGKVTNITSDHVLNSNASTNPVIKWFWDRAPDDASGIQGYSVWVQQGILPGMPDAWMDIGDVTTYTSGPHTPGWYYISIRAIDRNGVWSDTYETYGPVGIRAADPANLVVKIHSNWDYLGVTARHVADSSPFSSLAPSYLDGTGGTTYLSAIYNNSGEQPTNSNTGQFWSSIFLDGYPVAFQHRITPLNPFEYEYILNKPVVIGPGRHVLRVQCDASELLAEPNEIDNYWARQWAWVPPLSYAGSTNFYNSPPRMWEDTQWIVDGSAYYPNSRGFRIVDSSGNPNTMWLATSLHASDGADYDLAVSEANNSPTAGYTNTLAGSYRGAYGTDIVLINCWYLFLRPWVYDYSVLNYSGGSPGVNGFHLQTVASSPIGYPGSLGGSFAANEMVKLYQFDTSGGSLFARVQVQDPALGRLYMSVVRGNDFGLMGALHSAGNLVVTDAATGEATFTGSFAADHMVLAVWRDPTMGTGPLAFNVSVQPHPPDLAVATPPGWAAPLVPRPANDGTPGAVPAPAFLVGDAAQTYLNYAMVNGSPIAVPPNPTLRAFFYRDGLWFSSDNPPPPGGNVTTYRNLASPITVKGGRHVLGLHIDATDAIPEMSASNNFTAGQWVWRPATIPFDAAQAIAQPPDRFGGWNLLPAGTPLWFNMDGVRSGASTPDGQGNGYKVAFATIPDAGKDVDLKLYEGAPDAVTGFDVELASSAWGIDQVDYVLADFRATTPRAFDAGFPAPAVQAGTGLVETRLSKNLGAGPASPAAVAPASRESSTAPASISGLGPLTIGAGHLFDAYEIDLPIGNYDVRLVPGTGSIDWGVALHAPGEAFQSRSDALPGGTSWEAPVGGIELMEVTVPTPGWHTVVVWKNRRADVDIAGTFTLEFNLQTTGVPEVPAPPVHRLIAAVRPNPFTAGTQVDIRLEAGADVELQVFDLGGRRVFDRRVGHLESGEHALAWDGRDQEGRPTPTGIYFIRILADGTSDRRKVVKVQ
jgi:hypothetical protein